MSVGTSHLKDYLDYYISLESPGYAVLVTGEWGTGKTHQVRAAILEDKSFYVSLFGMSRSDEITSAIYAKMFPIKAGLKKAAKAMSSTSAQVAGYGSLGIGGLPEALAGALLRDQVTNKKPIIFDDLERCTLSNKEILGIINHYVEHHGCRVIVIAHNEKLKKAFRAAKEKIFGQTLRVTPQISDAFDSFHGKISSRLERQIVGKYKPTILGIFKQSGAQSLRILRHVIYDLARLVGMLSDEQRANVEALDELVRVFSALNIEWRAERLLPEEIKGRALSEFSANRTPKDDERRNWMAEAKGRYGGTDLTSSLLIDDVLFEMFVFGIYDQKRIQGSIDQSAYFMKPQEEAPWRVAINFDRLDDDIVQASMARMEKQLKDQAATDPGEILHIFALKMLQSDAGGSKAACKEIAVDACRYIDNLFKAQKLPARDLTPGWERKYSSAAFGVSYWVPESCERSFRKVLEHLLSTQEKCLTQKFPEIAAQLLKYLASDGRSFFEQVCHSSAGNNLYATVPVLRAIDPAVFVKTWLSSPKENWHWIARALEDRYVGTQLNTHLKSERSWVSAVRSQMERETKSLSGLSRLRLERIIKQIPMVDIEAK